MELNITMKSEFKLHRKFHMGTPRPNLLYNVLERLAELGRVLLPGAWKIGTSESYVSRDDEKEDCKIKDLSACKTLGKTVLA